MDLPAGLDQLFEVGDILGQGASGTVLRAVHRGSLRPVALKVLDFRAKDDLDAQARFREEARLAERVTSPHVAGIIEAGECGGHLYIAYELVEGSSLRQLLDSHGPLSWGDAEPLMRGILDGLSAIHAHGIVHRDLKPSNILIDPAGAPRIIDFGIARELARGERRTQTGEFLGTPSYVSPEQIEGGTITPAADLYSAGAIFYEILAGRPPFPGTNFYELLGAQLKLAPPPLHEKAPAAPRGVTGVIHRLLEKKPPDRFATAGAVIAELEAAIGRERLGAAAHWGRRMSGVLARHRPRAWGAALAALMVLVIGGCWSIFRSVAPPAPAPRALTASAVRLLEQSASLGISTPDRTRFAGLLRDVLEDPEGVPWTVLHRGLPLWQSLSHHIDKLVRGGVVPEPELAELLMHHASENFDRAPYWLIRAQIECARGSSARPSWSAVRGLCLAHGRAGDDRSLAVRLYLVLVDIISGSRHGRGGISLWELLFLRGAHLAARGAAGERELALQAVAACRLIQALGAAGYPAAAARVASELTGKGGRAPGRNEDPCATVSGTAPGVVAIAPATAPKAPVPSNQLALGRVVEHKAAYQRCRRTTGQGLQARRELLSAIELLFQLPPEADRDRRCTELLSMLADDLLETQGREGEGGLMDPAASIYFSIAIIDLALALIDDDADPQLFRLRPALIAARYRREKLLAPRS